MFILIVAVAQDIVYCSFTHKNIVHQQISPKRIMMDCYIMSREVVHTIIAKVGLWPQENVWSECRMKLVQ